MAGSVIKLSKFAKCDFVLSVYFAKANIHKNCHSSAKPLLLKAFYYLSKWLINAVHFVEEKNSWIV